MKKTNVTTLVQLAVLTAIMLILTFTPLGLIALPFLPLSITVMHIPVIIAGCTLGPKYGGFMGFLFGAASFVNNSFIAPKVTSFVFTPLYSMGDFHGNFGSIIICFVPRILIGVFAGLLFKWLQSRNLNTTLSGVLAGIVGSLTNTILVMGGIALIFGGQFLEATKASEALLVVIGGSIVANGIPEAIGAGILVPVIVTPLLKITKRN